MIIEQVWLLKVVSAHLLTDFILQPGTWVKQRSRLHFASPLLYLHALITGGMVLLFTGYGYWPAAAFIAVTHFFIDVWKSYRKEDVGYFLADQFAHLLVILLCWYYYFVPWDKLVTTVDTLAISNNLWLYALALLFLTSPSGILIGQLTKKWREKILNPESLANAGKWIGIIERLIVFMFVLLGEYSAISLLIAAKGIIRFNEKDRPEVKTEYLVIGTLMSITIALIFGIGVKKLVL